MTAQKIKKILKGPGIGGFTLVELLIVIALLGVIALIVIAAINPIEQANRARDTRFKADGAQLISATDRYFTAFSEFPWVTPAASAYTNDSSFGFVTANDIGVGLCGDATCSTDGLLITSDELKSEFADRDFISATSPDKQLFIGKAAGTSESIYACYIPASKANRAKSNTAGKVYSIDASGGRTAKTCDPDLAWDTAGSECYVCIPE